MVTSDKPIRNRRDFPSVEELLQSDLLAQALDSVPRPLAAAVIRDVITAHKARLGKGNGASTVGGLCEDIRQAVWLRKREEISRVINAAGIIVHTNLGRAPLSEAMFDAIKATVLGYGNIEFDLDTGRRGSRGAACERYLAMLAGAEAGTIVNNCAAALFVMLNTLANRRRVAISRGELVQIGGGFRIPDILRRAGGKLAEVGTTNITTLADYESALDDGVALILKVHKSNFIQGGFTEEVPLKQLVELGRSKQVLVINDLGSGVFIDTQPLLGYREPTVQQSVRDGADLTSFSGDKMLGGIQAGLIVGRADLVAKIKKNPVFRAFRVDKVVFSMVERLLTIYLNGTHADDIKLWSIVSIPESELYRRAKQLVKELGNPAGVSVEATRAYMGGGALPEAALPSVGIVFDSSLKATSLMKRFRALEPPIIGRIEGDRFVLDLKAVDVADYPALREAVTRVLG
jgi:L-seryl-tRNA(Ser) seleniumtransferase